jgi:hypothetical protein
MEYSYKCIEQSQTTDKGWSFCIGLSVGLKTIHCKMFTVFGIKRIHDKDYLTKTPEERSRGNTL